MLNHGGCLNVAAKQFGIPIKNWIDLSTGINPNHWPIPTIPDKYFTRLPEDDDGLVEAAQKYYQADNLLPVAGSQSVIQLLPLLREKSKVAVPIIGYAEHGYQWQAAGHEVIFYKASDLDNIVNDVDVLIVINPNNPTGEIYTKKQLLAWHKILQSKQGWLIVDEAFTDTEEISSIVNMTHQSGLIVLRSVGKFFGLAGVRSGFVFAKKSFLEEINEKLGPWTLTGVSRYVTKMALLDSEWILNSKQALSQASDLMHNIILECSGIKPTGTKLFKTIIHVQAECIFELFAMQGIFVRLLDNKKGLRFGLPRDGDWEKVQQVFEFVFSQVNEQDKSGIRTKA